MPMTYTKFLLVAIISGLFLGLSFPHSIGVFPLACIALVPIIYFNVWINSTIKRRFFKRFLGNYIFMLVFNLTATWWIKNASLEGSLMAFLANSILMTLPFFFFGFFTRILGDFKGLIGLVVTWLSFEYIHHYWDLSWPWLSLGNIFGNQPKLIQWYEYSGILGGSLWILLVNIVVYIIFRNLFLRKEILKFQTPNFYLLVGVIFAPIISSLIIFFNYDEQKDPIEIAIIQPNYNPWNADFSAAGPKFSTPVTTQLDVMLGLAKEKMTDSTDFILFPETALASFIDESLLDNMGSIHKLRKFSGENQNIPLLIGADTYKFFDEKRAYPAQEKKGRWFENYNTALLLDSRNPIDIYHKSKLVLGAEKMPFVDIFPIIGEWSVGLGGTSSILVANTESHVFKPRGIVAAPLICYESVYGEFVTEFTKRGAEVICVITNDGWWGDTPGYKQHLMFSQIRAIENRRPVLRSANTGVSCYINQKGEIIESLNWNIRGAILAKVNKNQAITFYVKYGNLIGRVSSFLFLGILLMAISNKIRFGKKD